MSGRTYKAIIATAAMMDGAKRMASRMFMMFLSGLGNAQGLMAREGLGFDAKMTGEAYSFGADAIKHA